MRGGWVYIAEPAERHSLSRRDQRYCAARMGASRSCGRGLSQTVWPEALSLCPTSRRYPHSDPAREKSEALAARLEGSPDPGGQPRLERSLRSARVSTWTAG